MPKFNLSQQHKKAIELTPIRNGSGNDYKTIFGDTKRFYEQVRRTEIKKSELLQQIVVAQKSKAENRFEKHRDLLQALDPLKDHHKHLVSLHKEKLDDFIVVCEEIILGTTSPERLQDIHDDLLQAGFNFESHGVDHPILLQLDQNIKHGTLH